MRREYPENAPGYVVRRQPRDAVEVAQMVEVAWAAEVECVRYRGRDERVRRLLRERGAEHAIDGLE